MMRKNYRLTCIVVAGLVAAWTTPVAADSTDSDLTAAVKLLIAKVEQMESRLLAMESRVGTTGVTAQVATAGRMPEDREARVALAVLQGVSEDSPKTVESASMVEELGRMAMKVQALEARLMSSAEIAGGAAADEPVGSIYLRQPPFQPIHGSTAQPQFERSHRSGVRA